MNVLMKVVVVSLTIWLYNLEMVVIQLGVYRAMQKLQEKIIVDSCGDSRYKQWHGKPKMSTEVARNSNVSLRPRRGHFPTGEPDYDRFPTKYVILGWFSLQIYDMDQKHLYIPKNESHTTPPVPLFLRHHMLRD